MIGSILFNIIFWPLFGLWLTILYPITYFLSARMTLVLPYRTGAKLMVLCLKYLCRIDHKIKNLDKLKELLKKSPVIIGCNHQSAWETFIFSILFDEISVVVKKELLSVPVAGLVFKRLGCIPVDRSSPISAIKSLLKYGKKSIERGISIVIFPNGTRDSFEEKADYKSGIYAMYKSFNVPVLPSLLNSGKFWPRRTLKKNKGTIILDFKDPIMPGLSKEDFFNEFEKKMNPEGINTEINNS